MKETLDNLQAPDDEDTRQFSVRVDDMVQRGQRWVVAKWCLIVVSTGALIDITGRASLMPSLYRKKLADKIVKLDDLTARHVDKGTAWWHEVAKFVLPEIPTSVKYRVLRAAFPEGEGIEYILEE